MVAQTRIDVNIYFHGISRSDSYIIRKIHHIIVTINGTIVGNEVKRTQTDKHTAYFTTYINKRYTNC